MVVDEQTRRLKERDQELTCLESSLHFAQREAHLDP